MSKEPNNSPWKKSRFERLIEKILHPFSPLMRLVLGISEAEAKQKKEKKAAKRAEKEARKAAKQAKKAEKKAAKAALKAAYRAAQDAKKAQKASLKTSLKKDSEQPAKASKEPPKSPSAEKSEAGQIGDIHTSSELPEFFGPHPKPDQTPLEAAEEALNAEIPAKTGIGAVFKKLMLLAMAPVFFFRKNFAKIGGFSPFPVTLREKIEKEGFFAGTSHYYKDKFQGLIKRPKKRKKPIDPLAAGNEPLELLEFRSPTMAIVNMPLPPIARYIVWVMLGLISSMFLAMFLLPLNKVVVVRGRLVSKRPMMVIQPADDGVVVDIKAQVGDIVHKGELLGVLDPRLSEADLEEVRKALKIYKAQVERLKAEVADRPYIPDESDPVALEEAKNYLHRQKDKQAQIEGLDQAIASQQTALQGAEASAAMYGSKLRIALELLRIRQAEQHHEVGTRLSTLQAQDAVMDTERQLIDAQKMANTAKSELKAAQAKRESYLQSWKADAYELLAQTEIKLATAQSSYTKANLKHDLIKLRAPEDGIVLSRGRISRGAVLTTGMPFMTLVPLKGGVEMIGSMATEDSGYVKTGAHAIIKFATFPYDRYGGAEGTVSVISADSFLPDQAVTENTQEAVLPPGGKQDLFFRVKIQLDRYTLHGTPKFFHPGPGQIVTADIDVGKRTMMQYLFGNARSSLTEGMREPS